MKLLEDLCIEQAKKLADMGEEVLDLKKTTRVKEGLPKIHSSRP